jgi:alkylation response protein AidB-like acyl-CoA dehydrogenase
MRWELSPEQEMFRDSFREWLAAYAATATVRQWLSDDDVGPFEARLAAEGWLGAGFSEEAGGQGGGLLELALAAEQLGYAAAPGGRRLRAVSRRRQPGRRVAARPEASRPHPVRRRPHLRRGARPAP